MSALDGVGTVGAMPYRCDVVLGDESVERVVSTSTSLLASVSCVVTHLDEANLPTPTLGATRTLQSLRRAPPTPATLRPRSSGITGGQVTESDPPSPGHCQVTESDPFLRVPMRMHTVPRLRGVVTEMKY